MKRCHLGLKCDACSLIQKDKFTSKTPDIIILQRPVANTELSGQEVSGMLEVIAPEDGFVLEKCMPLSRHNSLGRTDALKGQKNWNGRLHVFGPKGRVFARDTEESNGNLPLNKLLLNQSRQCHGSIGCRKASTSRPYKPSKQILLPTAEPLEKQSALTSSVCQNLKTTESQHKNIQEEAEIHNDPHLKDNLQKLNHETEITEANMESKGNGEKEETSKNVEETPQSVSGTETQESSVGKKNAGEKSSDSSDDDECNHEQTGGEAEKRTAPLELMGEFLKAIMEQDYSLAKKLCQMILIYEPQNPEATQFLPLIERKLQLESIQEADDEGTDEGSTDDSEEDASDTEDSATQDEESSEDSGT